MTWLEIILGVCLVAQCGVSLWLYLSRALCLFEISQLEESLRYGQAESKRLEAEMEIVKSRRADLANELAEWGKRAGLAEAKLAQEHESNMQLRGMLRAIPQSVKPDKQRTHGAVNE